MHHEWEYLNPWIERFFKNKLRRLNNERNFDVVRYIAEHFDERNQEFDEIDLFSMMTTMKERQLIEQQVLQNQNIVYSIVTREPEMVTRALRLANVGEMEIEPIYKTKYKSIETDLFESGPSVDIDHDFQIIDMKHPHPYHKIATFIREPKE